MYRNAVTLGYEEAQLDTPERHRPHTAAMDAYGKELRRVRDLAKLSRSALARATGISDVHIEFLEGAKRRPRESTTRRLAAAIVAANPRLGPSDELTARLVRLIGEDLAPESSRVERIERRRDRHVRKLARDRDARLRPEQPVNLYLARQLESTRTILATTKETLAKERSSSSRLIESMVAELEVVKAELTQVRRARRAAGTGVVPVIVPHPDRAFAHSTAGSANGSDGNDCSGQPQGVAELVSTSPARAALPFPAERPAHPEPRICVRDGCDEPAAQGGRLCAPHHYG